jgi:hypothetical protein
MDIFGRYFKHSPTELPTELICRHLAVAATRTDEYTNGYIRSVFHILTDRLTDSYVSSVSHNITDGIQIRRYISSGNLFFWRANSVSKTIGKWFFCFSDRYSDGRGNHRREESRRMLSVGDDVSKKITGELLITHRQNFSIGKTVKFCIGRGLGPTRESSQSTLFL